MPISIAGCLPRLLKFASLGLCLGVAALAASAGAQASSEKVIYSFNVKDANPAVGLIQLGGVLYGTTNGATSPATIFAVTPTGKLHTIATFDSKIYGPSALIAIGKVFYGVIYGGGGDPICACGFVFSATQKGEITILYSFKGGSDGAGPSGSLIELGGILYGATAGGGKGGCSRSYPGCGTIFSISPQGTYTQLYAFQGPTVGDGSFPVGPLTAVNGALYGTTYYGGASANQAASGTLFSLSLQGEEAVLHSFGLNKKDGIAPGAGLLSAGATLYGTTLAGGVGTVGTVYSIDLDGRHEKILHAFMENHTDGNSPTGGLIAVGNLLYGTTIAGGSFPGYGTVFSLTETGNEAIVYTFKGGPDALEPSSPLLYLAGNLYGTSITGGHDADRCDDYSCGTIFEVTP